MAVTTISGTTTQMVRDFHGDAPDARIDVALRMAARTVAHFAPEPDEASEEYFDACSDAELALSSYALATRFGQDSSKGISDLSRSFNKDEVVRRLVQDSLGSYFQDPAVQEVSNVGYVQRWR